MEKSCHPPKTHLDFIFPEHSFSYPYGVQHVMPMPIISTLCIMGGQLEDDILTGTMTKQNFTPLELVELVAYKCTGKYG